MRKVTQQIKEAFDAQKPRAVGNTMTDGQAVFLHGNKIIERRKYGVYFTLAGWNTPTTRERINGILFAGTPDGLAQKDFAPYYFKDGDTRTIEAREWYKV